MIAFVLKILAALCALLLLSGLGVWILGLRQPSQVISTYDSVILVAVKHADPNYVQANHAFDAALWRSRTAFPFVADGPAYWSDYALFAPDADWQAALGDQAQFADVYAAELSLAKVPAFLLGVLRAQHLLGLARRPNGPLPGAMHDIGDRPELMPSEATLQAALDAPETMQITMMNFLAYRPDETDGVAGGRRTYNRYGLEAMKAVHRVGGQFLFAGRVSTVLQAAENTPHATEWHDFAAMIYPDPTAILYMEQNPAYVRALVYRDAGLDQTRVIATEAY